MQQIVDPPQGPLLLGAAEEDFIGSPPSPGRVRPVAVVPAQEVAAEPVELRQAVDEPHETGQSLFEGAKNSLDASIRPGVPGPDEGGGQHPHHRGRRRPGHPLEGHQPAAVVVDGSQHKGREEAEHPDEGEIYDYVP